MAETQSAPSIPSEWGAAVAAKVARAIRDACGVEANKYYLAADEIDGACDEAVKAALQVLAEAFVIPGNVLAAHPTTLTEAVAAARAEGVREGLERAATAAENLASKSRLIESWWCETSAKSAAACIRALIPAPPTTPGGRTDG